MRRFLACCLAVILTALVSIATAQEADTSESAESIEDRIQPFGKVCMEGEDCGAAQPVNVASAGGRDGKTIYDKHCFACHATGVSDAPLVGADTWQPRLDKGMDVLLENTRNGFNVTMPPMGTCMDCTDEEFKASIEYMVTGE